MDEIILSKLKEAMAFDVYWKMYVDEKNIPINDARQKIAREMFNAGRMSGAAELLLDIANSGQCCEYSVGKIKKLQEKLLSRVAPED